MSSAQETMKDAGKKKVLIVEDDFVVRRGIQYSLEWDKYDLTICGDATNGQQGLIQMENLHPDIIITDIRMPIMDGLEFVERALEKSTQVKFIILSGYSDFEYAKRAIRLGVSDYLLKPIDADELMKCVCRLRDKIEQEQQEQKRRESLMNTFRTELLDQTVEKLFRTSFPEKKEQILRDLKTQGLSLLSQKYKVLVLVPENFLLLTRNHTKEERQKLIDGIIQRSLSAFENGCEIYCLWSGNNHFVILLGYSEASKLYLEECYRELLRKITADMGFLCSIACGLEKTSVDEIHLSYQEALHALRSHTIQIESGVFQYTGEEIGDQSGFLEIREEEQNLIHSILTYDPAGISACLDQIFDKAIAEKESFEKVSASCVRLASAVFSALDEMGLSFSGEFDTYQDTLLAIQGYHSVKHLRQFMGRFMEQVHVLLDQAEKRKYSSVVDQAVAYVKKHYQSELSVKSISAELYITPNYFSQIFKSQMGKNFTDYLNEVRVSHAKKLLRDKNRKVYEVAGECGYPNYKYFNSVFKKYTGYSPKEYRNGGV